MIIVSAVMTGCATTQDLQQVQRNVQEEKNRTALTQREIPQLKESIQNIQRNQAELDAKTDRIKIEIQNLQGKIDEIKFHAEKTSSDAMAMREELSSTLKEADEKFLALRKDLDALKASVPTQPRPVPEQPKPEGTPAASDVNNPEDLYNAAFNKMKSGDYEDARVEFKEFLKAHPRHELADNALFWIGESYYREKRYEEAVLDYEEVVKKYPKENKVPDAMLKEGLAFYELGKAKEAKFVLKKLIDKFPKSEQAKIAKGKIEQM